MTGDGAVREWLVTDVALPEHELLELFVLANAAIRQQAAEIERLTRDFEISRQAAHLFEDAANVGLDRALKAEARNADLLKALEDAEAILGALNAWVSLGMHKAMATGGPAQELMLKDIQACLTTIQAAAKGETV